MPSIEDAFEFLSEFDDGNIGFELPITPQHVENIRLLSTDLLAKSVDITGLSASEINILLREMVSVNTRWNRGLQESLDKAYRLAERNLLDEAAVLLNSFAKDCPSCFYGEIALDVKDEILGRKSE